MFKRNLRLTFQFPNFKFRIGNPPVFTKYWVSQVEYLEDLENLSAFMLALRKILYICKKFNDRKVRKLFTVFIIIFKGMKVIFFSNENTIKIQFLCQSLKISFHTIHLHIFFLGQRKNIEHWQGKKQTILGFLNLLFNNYRSN